MASKSKSKSKQKEYKYALLLDMDGVLAEVSQSYRAAIVATCHAYGATSVTVNTVNDWKARGGCNNDWVLSRDLILEHYANHNQDTTTTPDNDKITLEKVTQTFEEFYQGNPASGSPGLNRLETLIPHTDTIRLLAARCQGRVAIVTGRPRKDCSKFLALHRLDTIIRHSVCMEDGPAKPDPFPVRRAWEMLLLKNDDETNTNTETNADVPTKIFMVGDTPDDIRAAVAANNDNEDNDNDNDNCVFIGVGVATPEAAKAAIENGKTAIDTQLCLAMKECGASILLKPGFEELIQHMV